ncbi:LLM class F420-dependent oxidoreductase [Pseudonocardia lutea]|uniref:LLM class F420-dependent oxidoreductase n=1 Tax=Pseudonocardia lutea TaxID=2172015 RepID=A0ABW1I9N9_9PSEU
MKAGVQFFPGSRGPTAVQVAQAAEERGFESLFLPDHSHQPVAAGLDLPDDYSDLLDPFVTLGAVAASTSTIRIGTAVCLVPQRDPIQLAKEVATVDQLSGGRFDFGVGAGSDPQELRHHGTDPAQRHEVLRERVEAITRIWESDVASYCGEHVRFGPITSRPRPVTAPRPPILIGGNGRSVLDRVLGYGDGWIPFRAGAEQVGGDVPPDDGFAAALGGRIAELRARAEAQDRARPSVTLFNPLPRADALAAYAGVGVDRVVFWLAPPRGPRSLCGTLDRLIELVRDI